MQSYLAILKKQEQKKEIIINNKQDNLNHLNLHEQKVLAYDTILYDFINKEITKELNDKKFFEIKENVEKRLKDSVMKKISSYKNKDILLEYEEMKNGVLYFKYKKLY